MRLRTALVAAAFLVAVQARATAQVVPNDSWRTLETEHFRVHFTPELEDAARRGAANAERAYARLAAELTAPRGPIDLVVADNVDFSNGFATPFPSNRIVIYSTPPTGSPSLRFYDDWSELVITHELTHIFHLDRARGWWRAAQHVFGRVPFLMPNLYAPAWVSEGLATYYESRLTGAGRVAGSHLRMVVRASALANDVPRIDQLSSTTSRFPGGEIPYSFGALFLDHLARTRGEGSIAEFVERSSRATLPFTLNRVARRSFGISFTRAWREWRDSLRAHAGMPEDQPLDGWRDLTRTGRFAFYPRWLDSSALVFAANTGKELPGAYRADTTGHVRRLARRNGIDVNTPRPDGSLIFAQLEFTHPYNIRSDLYLARGGTERRLTRDARLGEPHVRHDGAIIAVQGMPATNQLVRVSADGRDITPITTASPDTQWAEPRWSPAGDRIAVTRWTRGGYADIVILDTLGTLLAPVTRDRAVDSSPDWTPDGMSVVFASDRTGVTELYSASADPSRNLESGVPRAAEQISRAATGLFYPTPSPDAKWLAAVHYRSDGWHVGIAPLGQKGGDDPSFATWLEAPPIPAPSRDSSRARRYSPWRSLLPRYWLPIIEEGSRGGLALGASTSGRDIVGRHEYVAFVSREIRHGEVSGSLEYRYAGLGMPLLDGGVRQEWDRFFLVDTSGAVAGDLLRRSRVASFAATIVRPRIRTSARVTLGGELERQSFETDPPLLLPGVRFRSGPTPAFRALFASAGWSNTKQPALAISLEDGIAVSAFARQRWREGVREVESREAIGVTSAYKSFDAGGFAHHVIAARVAGGYSNGRVPETFDVGGASGASVDLLPGVNVGGRETFGIRGYPRGAQIGERAAAGSVEYRFPLRIGGFGRSLLPIFLDRISGTVFGDAGAAWQPLPRSWLASAGGELNVDLGWLYDVPYRLRLGIAVPFVQPDFVGVDPLSVYVRLGTSF